MCKILFPEPQHENFQPIFNHATFQSNIYQPLHHMYDVRKSEVPAILHIKSRQAN